MASLTITLPDELSKYVEEQVAAGRGGDASAFIRSLLEEDQTVLEVDDELLAEIDAGIQEADRGELVDAEDVFEQLMRRSEELRRTSR